MKELKGSCYCPILAWKPMSNWDGNKKSCKRVSSLNMLWEGNNWKRTKKKLFTSECSFIKVEGLL